MNVVKKLLVGIVIIVIIALGLLFGGPEDRVVVRVPLGAPTAYPTPDWSKCDQLLSGGYDCNGAEPGRLPEPTP